MRVALVLTVLLVGCWESHVYEPTASSQSASPNAAPKMLPYPDDGSMEALVAPEILASDTLVAESAGAGGFEEGDGKKVWLYNVDPTFGCTNQDRMMFVNGSSMHWLATLELIYPYSEATALFAPDGNAVDEHGDPLYGWDDNSVMWFRTHPMVWDGMRRFVSGHYLITVTNPDGQMSNAAGLNLQHCDE